MNCQALLEELSADVLNMKLVANCITYHLLKFGNFWHSGLTSASIILAPYPTEISGWTVTEKPKDMTILELVLHKVLTTKVVHQDLRNALVKF